MDYIVNIIIAMLIAVLMVVLGYLAFSKNKKSITNRLFFIFTVSFVIWSILNFLESWTNSQELATLFLKLDFFSAPFAVFFMFLFLLNFPYANKKINSYFYLTILPILFISAASFTEIIIKNINFFNNKLGFEYGQLFGVYTSIILVYLLIGVIFQISQYTKSSGVIKSQIFYVLLGFSAAAFILVIFNLFLQNYISNQLFIIGNFSPIIFIFCTTYSIIAHRLMDIKMVLRKYLVYLLSLISILLAAVMVKYFFDRYLPQYSDWIDLAVLMGSISVYSAIRNRFYRIANKYFFSSLYDSGEVIASLSEKLRSTLETNIIFGFISETLTNAFHVKAIGILTYNENIKKYIINYNNGFNIGKQVEFNEDKELNELFIKRNRTIITDDIKVHFKNNKTLKILLKLGVEILTPLNVKDKTIGLIALGKKESGDMYNDEDLKVLEVVGAQAAISLENALLYKETKNFSIKLEKEVEKATRDLRKANVQLKKLDAAKSEFISIASHQLRTPLTVIKGYISMMLEGNFGDLTKLETESLEKVFVSNERLIQLVENLLNISRIESGRLQFDYKQVDLNSMVKSVIEELFGNAKKKNLILQYKPPAKPLSRLKLDDEKIRQVIMNLIDNAIKYTKQGSVTVRLEQNANKIKFSVADSGMGIRPEDMVNLFKKFSRGGGTSLIHTEGTGLGLYVARMMIEAHKGKIWAESDGEGKGSRFCFELPLK